MFGRIQDATNQAQGSAASSNQAGQIRNGSGGGRGGGGSSKGIAGSALRRAGLMDDDVGMRSASAAGPSRRGASGGGGKGLRRGAGNGGSASAGPSRIPSEDATGAGKARRARDRANPLGSRLSKNKGSISKEPTATGHAFAIRGAASGPNGKAKGGTSRASRSDASLVAATASIGGSLNTQGTIGVLRRFLASRWNGGANFLNLDSMKSDNILTQGGVVPPGQPGAHKDIGSVIWKLTAELYPSLVTLSLANNDFKTLGPCATLPQHLSYIQNLSLEGNDLKWTKDLTTFSKSKFGKLKNLRELMLSGNPMQQNAVAAQNEENYRAEVLANFPTLALLDRVSVTQKETAIAQLPSTSGKGKASEQSILGPETPARNFLVQTRSGFSDEAANGIVPGFLHKYFSLFDTARESQELRSAYASNATWSFCINHKVPPRAVSAGFLHSPDMPRQRDLNWNGYKQVFNHDIMSLGAKPAWKGFPIGPNPIMATLAKLPKTTHPLTDPHKFVVDSWILPNNTVLASVGTSGNTGPEKPEALLFINVKGEFAEAPSMGVRSFDRTFVVAPSNPASSAAQAGWPCVILSEQLTVRHYSGTAGWQPDTLPTEANPQPGQPAVPSQTTSTSQTTVNGSSPPVSQAPAADISAEQHSLAIQFSAESGLTYPYALQCLQENGWQPQTAMGVFQNLKSQGAIPPEAFTPGRA